MPSAKDNILEFNQYIKCHTSFMLILNLWLKKIDRCANNPENSSTTKIGEHIPCGYLISSI